MRRSFLFVLLIMTASCHHLGHSGKSDVTQTPSGYENKPAARKDALSAKTSREEELFTQGCTQKSIGNYDQAISSFQAIADFDPKSGAANYELAGLYLLQKKNDIALRYAKTAVEDDPDNKWYIIRYAEILSVSGQHDASIEEYRIASQQEPQNTDILLRLANEQKRAGKNEDALKTCEKIEGMEGISDTLAKLKISVCESTGNTPAEDATYKELVRYFPSSDNYARYDAFLEKAHMDQRSVLSDWQRKFPDDIRPQMKMAETELHSDVPGDRAKGFEHAMNIFKAFPGNEKEKVDFLRSNYAISDSLKLSGEKKKQADSLCASLRKYYPNDAGSYMISGDYAYSEGQKEKAAQYYGAAIRYGESGYQTYRRMMEIWSSMTALDSTEKYCRLTLELFPSQTEPYYYQGDVYYRKKDYRNASKWLQLGLDLSPDDARLNERMGDTAYRLDNIESAKTFWNKAKAAGANSPALDRKIGTGKMNDNE